MAFFGKEYACYKHENFDGFLKFVGIPADKLEANSKAISSQKLVKDGDSYVYISTGSDGVKETTFKSGVEFDDVIGLSKTPIKSTITVDGNTVIQSIKAPERGTTTFKKDFNGDELVVTITADGWDGVAKRFYKAQ